MLVFNTILILLPAIALAVPIPKAIPNPIPEANPIAVAEPGTFRPLAWGERVEGVCQPRDPKYGGFECVIETSTLPKPCPNPAHPCSECHVVGQAKRGDSVYCD